MRIRFYMRQQCTQLALLILLLPAACTAPASTHQRVPTYMELLAEAHSLSRDEIGGGRVTDNRLQAVVLNESLTDGERAEIVQVLIEKGALLDAPDLDGSTPMLWAARLGYMQTTQVLLAAGAGPDMANEAGESPLSVAIMRGDSALIQSLRLGGTGEEQSNNRNVSAYFAPALRGDRVAVDRLARLGTPLDVRGRSGLEGAALGSHAALVRRLVEHYNAHAASTNSYGETAATAAAESGSLEILKYLVQKGCPLEAGMHTPLMAGAAGGHVAVVTWLLDNGAGANDRRPGQPTPLLHALVREHVETSVALMRAGAPVPQHLTSDSTLNAAGHRTLADALIYLRRNAEARSHRKLAQTAYLQAARELDAAAEVYESLASSELLRQVLAGIFSGAAGALHPQEAQERAKQLAQVSALKYAEDSGTGLTGYHAAYDPQRAMRVGRMPASVNPLPMSSGILMINAAQCRTLSFSDLAQTTRSVAQEMRTRAQTQGEAAGG